MENDIQHKKGERYGTGNTNNQSIILYFISFKALEISFSFQHSSLQPSSFLFNISRSLGLSFGNRIETDKELGIRDPD
tara:strand:- start:911 stop:1144 length:234 start_codon:yes stop_codon:yes gene_type:complete